MADCRGCGYDMNGDNRLGAVRCTPRPRAPLSTMAKIKKREGIMS